MGPSLMGPKSFDLARIYESRGCATNVEMTVIYAGSAQVPGFMIWAISGSNFLTNWDF